jgi:hypothetical protein
MSAGLRRPPWGQRTKQGTRWPPSRFAPAHASVEYVESAGGAVVGHEDDDGVVVEAGLAQKGIELADVLVEIGDHAEEVLREAGAVVGIGVFFGDPCGAVGNVGGEVAEEGLVFGLAFGHPLHGLGEPEVGAVAFELLHLALIVVAAIEVVVVEFGGGGEAPAEVIFGGFKAALHGAVGIVVAEMPFAEESCAVAVLAKHVGHGGEIAA